MVSINNTLLLSLTCRREKIPSFKARKMIRADRTKTKTSSNVHVQAGHGHPSPFSKSHVLMGVQIINKLDHILLLNSAITVRLIAPEITRMIPNTYILKTFGVLLCHGEVTIRHWCGLPRYLYTPCSGISAKAPAKNSTFKIV